MFDEKEAVKAMSCLGDENLCHNSNACWQEE
jgi:hypothetical protein